MFKPLDDFTHWHWVSEDSCLLRFLASSTQDHIDQLSDKVTSELSDKHSLLSANRKLQVWLEQLLSSELQTGDKACLLDYVPAYDSLLLRFDIDVCDIFSVEKSLKQMATKINYKPSDKQTADGNIIDIPVCYDPALLKTLDFKESDDLVHDIEYVAQQCCLSIDEVIELHLSVQYRVFAVGFLPNFAYMGLSDKRLTIPRRTNPRKRVPAGAVAIADNQSAIYPQVSPGGWHVIGYCPLDLSGQGEIQFQAGDKINFTQIDTKRFGQLRKQSDAYHDASNERAR